MRKAMICVSFMLAVLQLWPLVFGHRSVIEVASPGAQAAVIIPVPKRAAVVASVPKPLPMAAKVSRPSAPSSCFAKYRSVYSACAAGDTACGGKASDKWDLCEATGFWPE